MITVRKHQINRVFKTLRNMNVKLYYVISIIFFNKNLNVKVLIGSKIKLSASQTPPALIRIVICNSSHFLLSGFKNITIL